MEGGAVGVGGVGAGEDGEADRRARVGGEAVADRGGQPGVGGEGAADLRVGVGGEAVEVSGVRVAVRDGAGPGGRVGEQGRHQVGGRDGVRQAAEVPGAGGGPDPLLGVGQQDAADGFGRVGPPLGEGGADLRVGVAGEPGAQVGGGAVGLGEGRPDPGGRVGGEPFPQVAVVGRAGADQRHPDPLVGVVGEAVVLGPGQRLVEDGGGRVPFEQGGELSRGQVGAGGELAGVPASGAGEQAVDQVGRQRGVGGEAGQHAVGAPFSGRR